MTFQVRPATENDIPAMAALFIDAWQAGFKYILREDTLGAMSAEEWSDPDLWFGDEQHWSLIAENENGQAAGFVNFGKLKTPPPGMSPIRPLYSAEIYNVNVHPSHWRQGIGQTLMQEAACVLKDHKHHSLCLWVIDKNKAALQFYKSLGGEKCGKKQSEILGTPVREACFGWRDTAPLLAL